MKKIVIRILTVIAVIALLIIGKIQIDKYRIKSITYGEEGKVAIENMLKIMDEKAFTLEGKIKSYKIDEDYTHKNPMGGLIVRVIINEWKYRLFLSLYCPLISKLTFCLFIPK